MEKIKMMFFKKFELEMEHDPLSKVGTQDPHLPCIRSENPTYEILSCELAAADCMISVMCNSNLAFERSR